MSIGKKTAPLFIFLKGQMHLYPSVYFHATDLKVNTLVTKFTDIFIFNFSHVIGHC